MQESLFAPGHRACAGCGMPIAIKLVLDAAGPKTIVASSTGCLEVTSTPFPESSWKVPWIHSLFENPSAVASGIEIALKKLGKKDINLLVIGGDGSTFDIGIGSISGMFDRGHNITYICYDNEAYMNTGVQKSGSTPFYANTTTTPIGTQSPGNLVKKKDMPAIAVANGASYVATASIAYPVDLRRKVKRSLETKGPAYIQINAPCITGWSYADGDTIEQAKLVVETCLYPLYEYVDGELVGSKKVRNKRPVDEYLKTQGRYKHLFRAEGGEVYIAEIQAIADGNAEKFGLLD